MPLGTRLQEGGVTHDPPRETLNFIGANVTDNATQNRTDVDVATIPAGTAITALAGATSFDYSAATGVFKTSTGANTFGGHVTVAANKNFTMAAGTGSVDLGSASGTMGTPTGAISVNGAVTFAANKGIATTAGTAAFDFSNGTGVFRTSTGAVAINGEVTIAANKGITAAAGSAAFDLSAASGIFKTSTGAVTLGGDTTLTAGRALNLGRATVSQATNINTDVTINGASGVITTQAATTAAETAEAGFVVNNACVAAGSAVIARVVGYSGTLMTHGIPEVSVTAVGSGTFNVKVMNLHGTNALNGTMKIHFIVA